jgi:hypothetical protein
MRTLGSLSLVTACGVLLLACHSRASVHPMFAVEPTYTVALATPTVDVSSDNETRGQPAGTDSQSTCPQGGCVVACGKGQNCEATCSGGGCTHRASAGATLSSTCSGGKCLQECQSGATCAFTCSGGGCTQSCAAGSTCSKTCSGKGCT